MFRSLLFDHPQGAVFRASCCYYFSACLRSQVVYFVYGCILQPNLPQTGTSGTHTHGQYTATYQINNLTTQTSTEAVTARSAENGPLRMVKQEWPKHVGVLTL